MTPNVPLKIAAELTTKEAHYILSGQGYRERRGKIRPPDVLPHLVSGASDVPEFWRKLVDLNLATVQKDHDAGFWSLSWTDLGAQVGDLIYRAEMHAPSWLAMPEPKVKAAK